MRVGLAQLTSSTLIHLKNVEKKTLHQGPGDFYVSNMCAIEHEVLHSGSNRDCFSHSGYPEVKIAVMFRTDVFRDARARRKNAVPGPKDLFDIVNKEAARHLVEVPFVLPDLAAIAAENPGGDPSVAVAASAAAL